MHYAFIWFLVTKLTSHKHLQLQCDGKRRFLRSAGHFEKLLGFPSLIMHTHYV
jgi:hypothetical protein